MDEFNMYLRSCLLSALLFSASAWGGDYVFTGAGSTAAQPLYATLAKAYAVKNNARLDYQGIGSSAGIAKIKERAVDFGASDVAVAPQQLEKDKLICFPTAISGVVAVVNVPGVNSGNLQLTGELLAGIFSRKIQNWNDATLAAANPGLRLPNLPITTVARSDGSGTTYNFTDYLDKVSPEWHKQFGRDFKIGWPAGTVLVKGSGEVAKMVGQTRGAIAYIDFKYVLENKLTYAKLRNHDGKFVVPTGAGFASALKNSGWVSNARYEETLTDKEGAATWPITTGTFVLVPRVTPDADRTIAVLKFIMWGFVHGGDMVEGASFVPLPDKVHGRIFAELTSIRDSKGEPLHWSLAPILNAHP